MTRNQLLEHLISDFHTHPERGEWNVCVGAMRDGEFTVLTAIQPEPALSVYFVNAVQQSAL